MNLPKPYEQTIRVVDSTLREIFAAAEAWLDRSEEVRTFRPLSGGWTVDEVLEHITQTNHFLMMTLTKWTAIVQRRRSRVASIPIGESDLTRIDVIGRHGSFPWPHPAHMTPTGRLSVDEIRTLLRRQLEKCLSLLDELRDGRGSLCAIRMTVADLGKIDLYQWLYFLAQHIRRHLQQMQVIETTFIESAHSES